MENNLIIVKQLPVIEQQLLSVKSAIEQRTQTALAMACTEDTVKEIKKERAALNAEFKALEDRRKNVKAQVMAPYEAFEAVYKECASDIYKDADAKLKQRIDDVERTLKQEKANQVTAYFNEYRDSLGLDFVSFSDAKIAVTLGVSMKKLKEAAKDFLDRVKSDLDLIQSQEYPEEILVEYKRTLEVNGSILAVKERHARILAEQARAAARREAQEREAAAVQQVEAAAEAWAAPEPVEAPEEQENPQAVEEDHPDFVEVPIKRIAGTPEMIRALVKFLQEGGYQYE